MIRHKTKIIETDFARSTGKSVKYKIKNNKVPVIRILLLISALIIVQKFFLEKGFSEKKIFSNKKKIKKLTEVANEWSFLNNKIYKINENETLFQIYDNFSVKKENQVEVFSALTEVYPYKIFEDQEYIIDVSPDSLIRFFAIRSKDRCLIYKVTLDTANGYKAQELRLPTTKITKKINGVVESSLYSSIIKAGEDPELIQNFIDLFSWDINWFFDPRKNDKYCILFEKYYYKDEFIKYGNILAGLYKNKDKYFTAYYFNPDSSVKGYFKGDGSSVKRSFLKAPLRYSRISSKFNPNRLHPILNIRRPHLAVDYAAPTGTPIRSASSGKVVYAEVRGGYGKCVKIDHGNSYATYYGHLSSYARGIKRNKKVEQGDVIGYVGQTGLATGPHLDYRITKNRKPIDPLKLKAPSIMKIPNDYFKMFIDYKNELNKKIDISVEDKLLETADADRSEDKKID